MPYIHADTKAQSQLLPDKSGVPRVCGNIKMLLQKVWGAEEVTKELPSKKIEELARAKYGQKEWNYRL